MRTAFWVFHLSTIPTHLGSLQSSLAAHSVPKTSEFTSRREPLSFLAGRDFRTRMISSYDFVVAAGGTGS